MKNWATNVDYGVEPVSPVSVADLQGLVAGCARVRALGSRHSFNDLPRSETLVSLRGLPRVFEVDSGRAVVLVDGGSTYADLCPRLHSAGFGLANLASLPHISIAGAIATGTHGSGDRLGNLATSVIGLQFVRPDGSLEWVREGDADFEGSVVHLGMLGPVVTLELRIEPTYEVRQDVYLGLTQSEFLKRFDALTTLGTSVSFFTRWTKAGVEQVWIKNRDLAAPAVGVFGAKRSREQVHPLAGFSPEPCTEQGAPGPWFQRLPHFRAELEPSGAGAELQSEYILDRNQARPALRALFELGEQITPHLYTSEVRTIAGDRLWMSPNYNRESVGIHFTWLPQLDGVSQVLPAIEEVLLPLGARPHWGKLFATHDMGARFPMASQFSALARRVDPTGKFQNAFLAEKLGL